MRLSAALVLVPFLALAACEPARLSTEVGTGTAGSASSAAIAAANCEAELYQHLVGGPIELADEVTYIGTVRVLAHDEFLTKDYDPSRLTITTRRDRSGDVVGRVFCG